MIAYGWFFCILENDWRRMIRYYLGSTVQETDGNEIRDADSPVLYVVGEKEVQALLKDLNISYEGELNLKSVYFCKAEAQQNIMCGTLAVPRLLDVLGSRYRIIFIITQSQIILINDDDFVVRTIKSIQNRRRYQGDARISFLYYFLLEFINRHTELLEEMEKSLMLMEDNVIAGRFQDFQGQILPIRKQLLILRGYYDQMEDMCKILEENENGLFSQKQLQCFGVVADRADRLMGKTIHLIDYAKQVQDAYQAQVDAKQNANMQFLTIISTIFFPLTLVTGWYGMNFENMPELENGYPYIILLSVLVVAVCIFIFKKKNIL